MNSVPNAAAKSAKGTPIPTPTPITVPVDVPLLVEGHAEVVAPVAVFEGLGPVDEAVELDAEFEAKGLPTIPEIFPFWTVNNCP
jgi:hypothetical protein